MRESNWLAASSEGPARQFGEVAIIEKILSLLAIPQENLWCVDFGAGNGVSASNSNFFITDREFSGVLIEPDRRRFKALSDLYKERSDVICENSFVEFEGVNSLDKILERTNIPSEFAFLSIDIDGNDYHIWESFKNYKPLVVCIEINETVPPGVPFVQAKDFSVSQGAGIESMTSLAKQKGYELVCVSENNAFYVRDSYFPRFEIVDNSTMRMCEGQKSYTQIFFGYDGRVFLHGEGRLRWHSSDLNVERLQVVPKFLRKFPPNYSPLERFLFRIWRLMYSPRVFIRDVRGRLLGR